MLGVTLRRKSKVKHINDLNINIIFIYGFFAALEQQLENEHEERTLLLREKHELERRLAAAVESERHGRAGDEALLQRLKRDLKRTKVLLRDTQAQLERQKSETPGKLFP